MSSRSSSRSSTSQRQEDNRVGAEDGAVAIGAGSSITTVDPGLVAFGEQSLGVVSQLAAQFGSVAERAALTAEASLVAATELAAQNAEDPADKIRGQMGTVLIGLAGLFLIWGIFR